MIATAPVTSTTGAEVAPASSPESASTPLHTAAPPPISERTSTLRNGKKSFLPMPVRTQEQRDVHYMVKALRFANRSCATANNIINNVLMMHGPDEDTGGAGGEVDSARVPETAAAVVSSEASSSQLLTTPAISAPAAANAAAAAKRRPRFQDWKQVNQVLNHRQESTVGTKTWSKLSKQSRKDKLVQFADTFGREHAQMVTGDDIFALKQYLLACLERKKIARSKDVVYDTKTSAVREIVGLTFVQQERQFVIRNQDNNYVSALSSLMRNEDVNMEVAAMAVPSVKERRPRGRKSNASKDAAAAALAASASDPSAAPATDVAVELVTSMCVDTGKEDVIVHVDPDDTVTASKPALAGPWSEPSAEVAAAPLAKQRKLVAASGAASTYAESEHDAALPATKKRKRDSVGDVVEKPRKTRKGSSGSGVSTALNASARPVPSSKAFLRSLADDDDELSAEPIPHYA